MSHNPEGLQGAQISHSLAMILSAATEPHHNGEFIHKQRRALSNLHKRLIMGFEHVTVFHYDEFFKMTL